MKTESKPTVEVWEISRLVPYKRNVKIHSPEQIERLAKSIDRLGCQPIVVDADGEIIAGHGRRLALLKLGRDKAPVIVRYDLDKAEANALRIADNKAASTEYDVQMLSEEVIDLMALGIDAADLGFSAEELPQFDGSVMEINEAMFVEDVAAAVEEQKEENAKTAAEIDESAAPIADAFGFKRLTVAQSRRIRAFMTAQETKTGLRGADAFIVCLDEHGL